MRKKKKPVTQNVTTIIPTAGEKVGIYIGGKLVAIHNPVSITTHELNQN